MAVVHFIMVWGARLCFCAGISHTLGDGIKLRQRKSNPTARSYHSGYLSKWHPSRHHCFPKFKSIRNMPNYLNSGADGVALLGLEGIVSSISKDCCSIRA